LSPTKVLPSYGEHPTRRYRSVPRRQAAVARFFFLQEAERLGEERHYLRCTGTLKSGRVCNVILAARVAGLLVVKRAGFEMVAGDVKSVRCDRCGTNSELPSQPLSVPRVEILPV
jgi:hypothetical protein